MRAAALSLAFDGLHAEYALSSAHCDNAASLGVSRKLGYAKDGIERLVVRNRPVTAQRLRLNRASWQAHRSVCVEMSGLEPCLSWFGLAQRRRGRAGRDPRLSGAGCPAMACDSVGAGATASDQKGT